MACGVHVGRVEGYAIITNDWGAAQEMDTFTCCHCNGIQFIRPGSGTQRGYCFNCNHPTCGKERCLNCVPFERMIEEIEGRSRLRQAMDRA
jgi:hypothetical protein